MSVRSVTFQLKWRGVLSGGTKSISLLDLSGWCVLRAKLAIRPESFLCRQRRDVLCANALAQKGNSTRATHSPRPRNLCHSSLRRLPCLVYSAMANRRGARSLLSRRIRPIPPRSVTEEKAVSTRLATLRIGEPLYLSVRKWRDS